MHIATVMQWFVDSLTTQLARGDMSQAKLTASDIGHSSAMHTNRSTARQTTTDSTPTIMAYIPAMRQQ